MSPLCTWVRFRIWPFWAFLANFGEPVNSLGTNKKTFEVIFLLYTPQFVSTMMPCPILGFGQNLEHAKVTFLYRNERDTTTLHC